MSRFRENRDLTPSGRSRPPRRACDRGGAHCRRLVLRRRAHLDRRRPQVSRLHGSHAPSV